MKRRRPPASPDPHKPDRFEQERLKKLEAIEALGLDPWGHRFDGHVAIATARAKGPHRGRRHRGSRPCGGAAHAPQQQGQAQVLSPSGLTGRIQLMVSKADVSETQWKLIEHLDLGDIVGVDGTLSLNTAKSPSSSKSLRFLEVARAAAREVPRCRDTEMLLRQRYLDLIYSEGVLPRMLKRTKILESVRDTLRAHNYLEVETPVLHAIAGGAAARPFVTHHNALDIDLYLRIALELHLKRLLVGGMERVYEIGRVFRNEGIRPHAQSRIHDARAVPGLWRLSRHDGPDRRLIVVCVAGRRRAPTIP